MAWDIDSTPISNKRFRSLRNRLLFSYLLVIAAILGTFSAAVYILVARDRHQQLNTHLHQVADSSAGTLEIIVHEYRELTTEKEHLGYLQTKPDGTPLPMTLAELMSKYEGKARFPVDVEPVSPLQQGVEWYNQQRQLIVREGKLFLPTLLPAHIPQQGILIQQGHIRSFAQPVYMASATNPEKILGYIRVSESTLTLEAELRRLQWGLIVGVVTVSGLAALGGIWLTRESLQPVVQSFQQLQQFTSDASHELRNPLTAIRASIAVMQSHPERIHPADVEKLKAIAFASAQMSQLVDDLLLLARMDCQEVDRQGWRRITLDEILEDLVDLYSDRAAEAQISLTSQIIPNLEVNGDASQLQRLFTNLLANALQYTAPGGKVVVSLQQKGIYAIVSFEDTGMGIAPEQLSHIFDRFWRADQARRQHDNGSGLGLAIAKTIAQHHQGDITVRSELVAGSDFQVKIPLASVEPQILSPGFPSSLLFPGKLTTTQKEEIF